jgi:hypothetical protein
MNTAVILSLVLLNILIVILVICVCYLIYRRFCKKTYLMHQELYKQGVLNKVEELEKEMRLSVGKELIKIKEENSRLRESRRDEYEERGGSTLLKRSGGTLYGKGSVGSGDLYYSKGEVGGQLSNNKGGDLYYSTADGNKNKSINAGGNLVTGNMTEEEIRILNEFFDK